MRRSPIKGIDVFLAIVQEGSLRAAAKSLGIGAPAVSHQLKSLENSLGVDLMVRTTRSIELTEAGRTFLAGIAPAFEQIAGTIESTREIGKSKTGTLRLTMTRSMFKIVIAPILADFQTAYPDVGFEFSMQEALVDIVTEGFHAGIRLGDKLTPGMVAVRVTPPLTPAYSAAPSYLDKYGRPQHPRDLLKHKCVRYRLPSSNRLFDWQYVEDDKLKTIDPPSKLTFDNIQMATRASRDGHGIAWSLRAVIQEDLAAGTLETVLDSYVAELPPFYLYFPEQNRRHELLRLLIDSLVARRDREVDGIL